MICSAHVFPSLLLLNNIFHSDLVNNMAHHVIVLVTFALSATLFLMKTNTHTVCTSDWLPFHHRRLSSPCEIMYHILPCPLHTSHTKNRVPGNCHNFLVSESVKTLLKPELRCLKREVTNRREFMYNAMRGGKGVGAKKTQCNRQDKNNSVQLYDGDRW